MLAPDSCRACARTPCHALPRACRRSPVYLLMYCALGAAAAYLCATFVFPITAGAAHAFACQRVFSPAPLGRWAWPTYCRPM